MSELGNIARSEGDVAEKMRRRGMVEQSLTVIGSRRLTPHMQQITVVANGEEAFNPKPGQSLVLKLPDANGELVRRHYTIRRYDPVTKHMDIDLVLHGDSSPGARWAVTAQIGDTLTANGPRGHVKLYPDADWRLFVGDETCIPAIFSMLEALPTQTSALAIIEVESDAERQEVTSAANVDIEWLARGGPAIPASPRLIEHVAQFEFPSGFGHIYLIGETSTVRAQRQGLLARGFPADNIFAEGYWRPGRHGGHDHV